MKVCIIIPVFNEQDFIEKSVESLINQTIKPAEVIYVNDNSTDNSKNIIKNLISKCEWIRVIDHKSFQKHVPGSKVIEAFNFGLKNLETQFDIICKFDGEKFYLGHDEPQEAVSIKWLRDQQLWCHAKSYNALEGMVAYGIHCFFHHNDKYTITSQGWIWAFPGQPVGAYTIAVHPEQLTAEQLEKCSGVCSDYVSNFEK